jgi:RHS repeat-associated protein
LDFTGQRLDGTGLHFYNARYYDSVLGRFVSADTIVPDPTSSQLYNRYAYAINNPVRYTDPTGHCGPLTPVCVGLAVLGAAYVIGRTGFEVAASIPDSTAYRSTRDVIGGALATDVSEVITAQAAQHSVDSVLIGAVLRHESAAGERRIWTLLPLSQPGGLADVFETVEAYARQDTFDRPASIGPGQMQLRRAIELEALGYVTPRTSDRDRIQALLGKESSVEYVAGMLHHLSDQLNTVSGFSALSEENQQRLILLGYNWGWTKEFQDELTRLGPEKFISEYKYDNETLDEYLRWAQ